ncbi:hypothetical protein [Povalibacter sp.]|uniref:hypothetical protein n=1 Tax=Povalibacter sp. TaxID=1962978 RepID=UPI002F3F8DF7
MTDRNKDVVPGTRASVLSRALLERTRELNRDYVELLLAERSLPAPGIVAESLPVKILGALDDLSSEARSALAACPYSLYALAFDDLRFWSAALDGTAAQGHDRSIEARYGAISPAPMQAAFCETAVFLAWHTAQSQRLAARFLFGMPDTIAHLLARAPLWQIRRVALDYPGLLAPRWPRNPAFWPDLVRFAEADDSRLEAARLLGSQLIASELDGTLPRSTRRRVALRPQPVRG